MINYSKKNKIIYGKMHNFIIIHNACHGFSGPACNRFTVYKVSKIEGPLEIVGRELPFGYAIKYVRKLNRNEKRKFQY